MDRGIEASLGVAELRELSLVELRAFRERIEQAIISGIRAQRLAKTSPTPPAAQIETVTPADLERERDAWLASRK